MDLVFKCSEFEPLLYCFSIPQDVINLMRSVALVSSLVSPALADEFSHALQRLVSPDLIARKLVADILTDDNDGQMATVPNFTQALSTRLQQIGIVICTVGIQLPALLLPETPTYRTFTSPLTE